MVWAEGGSFPGQGLRASGRIAQHTALEAFPPVANQTGPAAGWKGSIKMGRGFSRIPRIYMEQPSRNQKISPQRHEATKIHTGKNVAHPCLLRVLAVKAAPKRGTAEPAAEGAGADIRPKGRVNGGASQVAQQATVRQEGGAQRPNGREITY